MKFILTSLFILSYSTLRAQYFYNDIIGTREINQQMADYRNNKVKTVSASGFDNRGVKATDFSEYQEVKENGTALRITKINNQNKSNSYYRFNSDGRLISISDSSADIINKTNYEYDANGKIIRIENISSDTTGNFNHIETHYWYYLENSKPNKMLRVLHYTGALNEIDTLEVKLFPDEDGNPADERTYKNDKETGYLYYYYDDKNRLTDIVRFNSKLKKLMPDIMFEYDNKDKVIQKITTTSSLHLGYLIWRYIYNEQGLKTKEALFNNDKELTGKIEYSYTFSN